MTLPIPSGILPIPMGEVRRSSDILPPSAPVGISGIAPLDVRQALQMPEPVVTADQSSSARQSLERNFQENLAPYSTPQEPTATQAALVEISEQATHLLPEQLNQLASNSQVPYATDPLSQLLNQGGLQDTSGSATPDSSPSQILVGQALASSEMNTLNQLINDTLSRQISAQSASGNVPQGNLSSTVLWPGSDVSTQDALMTNVLQANDPKAVLNVLRGNLKNSGLFAAEQLAHVLLPANDSTSSAMGLSKPEPTLVDPASSASTAQALLQHLDPNSSSLVDAIRLALKGQLSWEGMLANNVPAKIQREDAWEANPNDPSQIIKGTRISVEVHLPKLGSMTVVGTQFQDQVYLNIQAQDLAVSKVFQAQLSSLQTNLQEQKIDSPIIQFKGN